MATMATTAHALLLLSTVTQALAADFALRGLRVRVEPFGADSLRVRARADGQDIDDSLPGALLPPPRPRAASEAGGAVRSGNIEASVDPQGLVTVSRVSDGKVLLREAAHDVGGGEGAQSPLNTISFASSPMEGLYGFGEHQQGRWSNKGARYDMEQCLDYGHSRGGEVCLPFVLGTSSSGGGCTWKAVPGCFLDKGDSRVYAAQVEPVQQADLTVERCVARCHLLDASFSYAAVEAGTQCFCGKAPPPAERREDDAKCKMPCGGNSSEACGGAWHLQAYSYQCSGPGTSAVEYGFLWNMPNYGNVAFDVAVTNWTAHAAKQTDYFITTYSEAAAGTQRAADIMRHYVDAVGHAPMLPEYAAGYWHSRNRYSTQEMLLEAAQGFVNRSVPVDVIVVDYHHWRTMGDWSFRPDAWPDVDGMVRQLTQMGMKVMVSAWPFTAVGSASIKEVESKGLAVADASGRRAVWWNDNNCGANCYLLDQSKKETRDFFWQRLSEGYFRHNISMFWLDASEPEISTTDARAAAKSAIYSKGPAQQTGMMFPYWHTQAIHDGLRSEGLQDGEIVMLTRSAWAGMSRFGAALWSGDTSSTWASLKVSLAAGINTQLSGIAWWTTDIGGYAGGKPADPGFRELVVRWFQYGATCPLFRQHGARETEIWKYGDESYAAIVKVIRWRRSIKAYVMEQMRAVSEAGTPVNRPLWWDFPEDAKAWQQTASFMFGPKYLVAPVTAPGAKSWTTYLPAGTKWQYSFDPSKSWEGGQEVTVATPLDEFPLFERIAAEGQELLV